ncbi:MAG: polyprenyl synthetase [candidate division NC10 bacterium RIFCSPLOWO2_12_FULL_66_18]|nr:MAG: polyprenyl synthetase [candidate division NC10 bacterium RIFCSPLOWO2_02_FULL_66_22]OGB99768.1 MAG: polyprenyl synthetase [candidate division NC10 bacterium RIFCSPLOWO2_12_FULL_66_18]
MGEPEPAGNLAAIMAERRRQVDEALERWLPQQGDHPPKVHEAMRYSVFAGGKRLRPLLALFACEAVGASPEDAMPAAVALELIHTYSLIHDDLPAMDDDDYRRGRRTCHRVYGEAVAILAGDALLTHAFQVLADPEPTRVSAAGRLQVIAEIAEAAGSRGMVGGQAMDILAEGRVIDRPTLLYLHTHKTGALIRASVRVGAIAGGAGEEQLQDLTRYGERLGLAFQIVDDILDIEGASTEMGKTAGSDLRRKKATYPAVMGLEESRRQAVHLLQEAKDALRLLGDKGSTLLALADFVGSRRH